MVQVDKSKLKNWEIGDTFAIKIENTNTEYDGQYFILIKCEKEEHLRHCSRETNQPYFYVKITTNGCIPQNIEEINDLEFVKITFQLWNRRFYPFRGMETYREARWRQRHIKFYPDEYKYLFSYIIQIWIKRGIKHEFQYIGNYDIKLPKEYIGSSPLFELYENNEKLVDRLIKFYNDFNLRKGYLYTEEGIRQIKKTNDDELKIIKNEDKYIKIYRKTGSFPSLKEIQKDIDKL